MVLIGKHRFTRFQLAVHAASLAPFVVLAVNYLANNLTYDPIQAGMQRTGRYAMILLLLSLACTPLNTILGFRPALKVRRALGLYAFFYAALHFFIFSVLDFQLDLGLIVREILYKNYLIVGSLALLILITLAFTSTQRSKQRMGRVWKTLHQGAYAAGGLVILHFMWAVKSDIREPLIYGAVLTALLVTRIPAVRKKLSARPPRWIGKVNRALAR